MNMRTGRRWASIGLAAIVLFGFTLTPLATAQDKKPRVKVLDKSKVYFPTVVRKTTGYKKPAVLSTAKVFASIDEWKKIKERKLTDKDAEYHQLLKKANEKFRKAVRSVQHSANYDIIAEKTGAIECKNCTPVNVTDAVIKALP